MRQKSKTPPGLAGSGKTQQQERTDSTTTPPITWEGLRRSGYTAALSRRLADMKELAAGDFEAAIADRFRGDAATIRVVTEGTGG